MNNNPEFKIKMSVREAVERLHDFAELVDEEHKTVGNYHVSIMVYEKYFARINGRVTLVLIIDNFDGETSVKAIGSGGTHGVYSDYDWGAADSFEMKVEKLFKDYLIR